MNFSPLLPTDLPWNEQLAFVLLDGASQTNLLERLKQHDPGVSSIALFDGTPFTELRDISPLLVTIEHPEAAIFQFYCEHAQEEWGVLLFSPEPAHAVAQHLRKLLAVEITEDLPVMLRLADAAVANVLFGSDDQRLFGPLSCVLTADCVAANWHRHQPRLPERLDLPTPYRLSAEQNSALDQADHRRALIELDAHLLSYFPAHHDGKTLAQRWPRLEQLREQARALDLSSKSELFFYANVMASMEGATPEQHSHIHQLLQTSSLQPPDERVALAAELAHQWAIQRGQS
ncbi:DUF4123 domain-containing protein [Pseudomonas sp. H1h]|uniref:DUF4123 domain-containing protein n=1 Tax=Pseudomonas sp. H1h TaxID=1397280 RepID=UPI00046A1921|nr:DUF4123 domain-containing protein [Pseudomonas sp. H1h]